eukprot:3725395-Pleurochrysis_carterae.AAC.1
MAIAWTSRSSAEVSRTFRQRTRLSIAFKSACMACGDARASATLCIPLHCGTSSPAQLTHRPPSGSLYHVRATFSSSVVKVFDEVQVPAITHMLQPFPPSCLPSAQGEFPPVTGEAKETVLGRHLQELSEHSRDSISESEKLAEWRRSLRSSFNTEEGAKLARENSILLAELRKEERIARKSSKEHKEHRGPAGETQASACEACGWRRWRMRLPTEGGGAAF